MARAVFLFLSVVLLACSDDKAKKDAELNQKLHEFKKVAEESKESLKRLEDEQRFQRQMDSVNRGHKVVR